MAIDRSHGAVRPLGDPPRQRPRNPVPWLMALALVLAGATAGYLVGLPGDGTSTATTTSDTPVAAQTAPTAPGHYVWLEQQAAAQDQDAWAVHAAVALDGVLWILVSDDQDSATSRVLWRSTDGASWDLVALDLGADLAVTDLDVYQGSLLLSGWVGNVPTVWRSQPLPASVDPVWSASQLLSELDQIGRLLPDASELEAEVNSAGEITVSANTRIALDEVLLDLSTDPFVNNLLQYDELPEIAVTGSRLWMRIVDSEGESVHTTEIPATVKVRSVAGRYGTDVSPLQAWSSWTSPDADTFEQVQPPTEPDEPLQPRAFGELFIGVVRTGVDRLEVWSSDDGSTWGTTRWVIPPDCAELTRSAVGNNQLLLTNDALDRFCVTADGNSWTTESSPETALSSNAAMFIEGSDGGFLAFARNALEYAVLTSPNGLDWQQIDIAPDILGTRTFLVGDRLVTTARPLGGLGPRPMIVWVGQPATADVTG